MSLVVIDPSLAVRWAVPGPYADRAEALLRRWQRDAIRRIAPALFASELASTLLRYVRARLVTVSEARTFLPELLALLTVITDDRALALRAFDIAYVMGAGRAYDSLYAALAEREGCEFWTGDERFFNAAHRRFRWVRWIGQPSVSSPPCSPTPSSRRRSHLPYPRYAQNSSTVMPASLMMLRRVPRGS